MSPGSVTTNRAPPSSPSSTARCRRGARRTLDEREPDADATPCAGTLSERLEDRVLDVVGHPGALVLDHQDDAVRPRRDLGHGRGAAPACAGARCRAGSRSMRSTLAASTRPARVTPRPGPGATASGSSAATAGPVAHVGRRALGLELPAVEAIEVEQVVDEARRLLARLLDHVVEVLELVLGQAELLGAADRLHRPEDPGERALEIVRDGVQQRVLHLVLLAEALGTLRLPVEVLPLGGDDPAQRRQQHSDRRGTPRTTRPRSTTGRRPSAGPTARSRRARQRSPARRSRHPRPGVPGDQQDRHQVERRERQAAAGEMVDHSDHRR